MRLMAIAAVALATAVTLGFSQAPADARRDRVEQAFRANNAGVAALERFDYAPAVAEFRRALALEPSLHLVRVNLALSLLYAGEPQTALKEALDAAKALPTEPRAWFAAGLAARAGGSDPAAISAFERVLQIDPADTGALVYLGQVHLQAGDVQQALARFSAAAAAEPYNATAAYGVAMSLLRAGRTADGQQALARFQALRDAPYAVTYADAYLEQGRYGEAIVSTGTEPPLVDTAMPGVRFSDVTGDAIGSAGAGNVTSVTLFDADGDGALDLVTMGPSGLRLFLREKASWLPSDALTVPGPIVGAVAADYDNDGRADLAVLGSRGVTLWRQTAGGRFENVTSRAGLAGAATGRTAAFADLDHDGDVDFVSGGAPGTPPLDAWRNNGNGTFTRFDPSVGLSHGAGEAASVVPTDFDNRRDLDLLVAGTHGVALLKNLRDGRFERTAIAAASATGAVTAVGTGDLNADGRTDFFLGRPDAAGIFLVSDGAAGFTVTEAPPATAGAQAAQFVDYDTDGILDLVTIGSRGLRVFRGTGSAWTEATGITEGRGGNEEEVPGHSGNTEGTQGRRANTEATQAAQTGVLGCGAGCALASADIDDDGDVDLVTVESGRLRVWRNDSPAPRSVTVRLEARVSNRSAIGARIEMRAGSLLRRFETSASTPAAASADITFGLGRRERADVVRVIWPSGIVQAETPPAPTNGRQAIRVVELDRKPSSCPYLFTWNGSRFEFVSDFLGGGELGYWLAPGVRNVPDPEEFVRIRADQLAEREGRYELRVTNELEEALFVDRLSLLAITHPAGTEVYPNEGLFAPPFPAHRLFVTRGARVPARVVDDHGHDVQDLVSAVDRRSPSDFALERFRGYARDHYIELDTPAHAGPRMLLLLTAWTDYAFSSDNVAASQAGMSLRPPSLEMADAAGGWRTIIDNIGIPVGRPQTLVVDLGGRVPARGARLRIRTNMRIYWDQVLIDTSEGAEVRTERIEPLSAGLRWRGYSAQVSPDGQAPFSYDYARVGVTAPWKLMPGRYTREGDVHPLVTAMDDRYVVSRPGDELAIAFGALPPVPEGWSRTFLLHAAGYSKEMDANSSSPDVAAPLPYHGMTSYPYDPAVRPLSEWLRAYVEQYNTRVVRRTLPLLAGPGPH